MNNVLEKIYTFARDAIKQLLDENPPLIVIINYGKVGYLLTQTIPSFSFSVILPSASLSPRAK